MSEARQALVDGLAELATQLGETYRYVPSGEDFVAVPSPLRPDDPRMAGSVDRLLSLAVPTASLPVVRPVSGADLTDTAFRKHRIVRVDDEPHGITTIIITA